VRTHLALHFRVDYESCETQEPGARIQELGGACSLRDRPHSRRHPRPRNCLPGWDVESKMQTGAWGFVPEGLGEGSLAVYCLECVYKRTRPVGYGLS
jgi:hypothetical protein